MIKFTYEAFLISLPELYNNNIEVHLHFNQCVSIFQRMSIMSNYSCLGVKLIEGVKVKKIVSEKGKVSLVQTSLGDIKCQYFVNAAGQVGKTSFSSILNRVYVFMFQL